MNSATAIPSLAVLLSDRIQRGGSLCFADFMAAALYEPGLGYYARGTRQVGRGGDFFTSVSVGPLFGHLLARRFARWWRESGSPERWRIIECGAHDGTLAADVLGALAELETPAFDSLEYAIPEPLATLQAAQRRTLEKFTERVRFIPDAAELAGDPLPGIAFGNEVLDALSCHIVERSSGQWLEWRVGLDDADRLVFHKEEIRNETLHLALERLGENFPEGYRTEIRTCFREFLAPLAAALSSGLMIWVDYGFPREDYYHPGRTEGTLRTFSKHRAGDDPLANPGEADITAHVDFTAVAEAAESLGWRQTLLRDQGRWLTDIGREWLLEMEGRPQPEALRQFQTLMHPAHLGAKFHALELSRA
jgi:SAM-dependent MidA family methyltransferase